MTHQQDTPTDRPIDDEPEAAGSGLVRRLNHAVLYVRDVPRSVTFYESTLGMHVVTRMGDRAAFLRAAGTDNHHDLGLFSVGDRAPSAPHGSVGLYHLAWQVATLEDLVEAGRRLQGLGALGGASDHGATKSLYASDPDGNELEVMWMVPREHWGAYDTQAVTEPLDLPAELARFGGTRTA
jgi:catechol-2,3-dioxygenase